MGYFVNENVESTERVFPEQGRYTYMRFDMNENPEGLPEDFVAEVLDEITPEFLATYPEPDRFIAKYAKAVGIAKECVTATNGSDQAIRYLLQTFCDVGHDVVTVSPSFEMYWVNCRLLGLNHVPVPYEDDLSFDMNKLLAAITPNTDVVVLLNPNNPIGDAFSSADVERAIKLAAKNDAVVIIDEAYHYFYKETFLDFINRYDNVIVLRTFSKLFSLAACRLGVILSNPTIINYVNTLKLSFDVNAVALKFGEHILDHPELRDNLIEIERDGRDWFLQELSAHGYETRRCEGNFVFVKTKKDAVWVAGALKERGFLVKYWTKGPLASYLRVSTGSRRMMNKLCEVLLEVDSN